MLSEQEQKFQGPGKSGGRLPVAISEGEGQLNVLAQALHLIGSLVVTPLNLSSSRFSDISCPGRLESPIADSTLFSHGFPSHKGIA